MPWSFSLCVLEHKTKLQNHVHDWVFSAIIGKSLTHEQSERLY